VAGESTSGTGVYGASSTAAGVTGASSQSVGVVGSGFTYGVEATGSKAQLYLVPAKKVGAPTSGGHLLGELLLDKDGTLFVCVAKGSPGTWKAVQVA
jgi:hypothetical protein